VQIDEDKIKRAVIIKPDQFDNGLFGGSSLLNRR